MPAERFKENRIDVVRLDPLEHLVVEIDRLFVRQPQEDGAKTRVGVAAIQPEVDLAKPEPSAEVDPAGPPLESLVVEVNGRRPVLRSLLVQPSLESGVGIAGQSALDARRR